MLLPVTVVEPVTTSPTALAPPPPPVARAPTGSIEINIRGAVVRVRGSVDESSLRAVLRALADTA